MFEQPYFVLDVEAPLLRLAATLPKNQQSEYDIDYVLERLVLAFNQGNQLYNPVINALFEIERYFAPRANLDQIKISNAVQNLAGHLTAEYEHHQLQRAAYTFRFIERAGYTSVTIQGVRTNGL